MNNNEAISNGYLTKDGFTRVYANATQANKAAARLREAGFEAKAFQSNASMRFLVKVV